MSDSAYQLCGALGHLVPLQVLQVQGARALDGDLCSKFLWFDDNDDHGGEDRDNGDDVENADAAAADDDDENDTAKCRTELKVSTCQAR